MLCVRQNFENYIPVVNIYLQSWVLCWFIVKNIKHAKFVSFSRLHVVKMFYWQYTVTEVVLDLVTDQRTCKLYCIWQVEECDIEEYDFDDYNSVASTASLLNIHAELAQEENNAAIRNQAQLSHTIPANQNSAFKTFQPKGTAKKETVINGTQSPNSASSPPQLREQLLRISKVQASISKVKNWGKYSNGALNTDEWREIFLEAAQAGDLRRLVKLSLSWK